MPKIRILEVPYTQNSLSDYLYLQISKSDFSTITNGDNHNEADITITVGYLWERLCIDQKQNLRLWKVAKVDDDYESNYIHFHKLITEENEFGGEAIKIDRNSIKEIEFKWDEILLIYEAKSKFSVWSFNIFFYFISSWLILY